MKYIKYGYGRATDQLCIEIRAGRMTRNQAIEALQLSDEGKIPWKFIPDFLDYLSITKEQFLSNLDSFSNKMIFARNEDNGKLKKDSAGNLIPKFRPQVEETRH